MGGGRKKGKAPPEPQEAEDFIGGLSLLEADGGDWSSPGGPPTGWGATSIQEVEDEDEDDEDEDEDEEEEEDEPVPRKGRKQQSQNQQQSQNHHHNSKQSGKGPQKQKGHQGNQSRPGPQSGQRNNNPHRSQEKTQQRKQPQNQKAQGNQKSKQGSKTQKQHQEPPVEGPEWGVKEGGYGGWNPGGSSVGSVSGGGGEWGMSRNQPYLTQHQHRLASLLEDIPEERGRTRSNFNQQGPKQQGRVPTPAEHVSVAASGNVPSRTLFYAVSNSAVSVLDGGASDGQHAPIQIYTSGGAALAVANRALYSHERPASQRIHWLFNPRKDIRVASLLDWMQGMSYGLTTVGLHNFLETQQRGALVANADYRTLKNAPAFDWLTFDDVIATHDKILQESMAFYEPDNEVLVFVFLLSHSGNSLAMWRRKLPVPIAIRNPNRREITRIMNSLARRKYVVTVDELPPPPPPPPQPKSKKKWFPW